MKRWIAGSLACLMLTVCTVSEMPQTYAQEQTAVYALAQTKALSNPILSRNVPAYTNSGTASSGNDAHYYTAWQASAPAFLAYDLSGVEQSKRKQVIAVWYNDSTYDNIGAYVNKGEEPVDYTPPSAVWISWIIHPAVRQTAHAPMQWKPPLPSMSRVVS